MMSRLVTVVAVATAVAVGVWCGIRSTDGPKQSDITNPPANPVATGPAGSATDSAAESAESFETPARASAASIPVKTVASSRTVTGCSTCSDGTCTASGCEATTCSSCSLVSDSSESADDPAADGWQSEIVHDHVKHQLKEMARFVARPDGSAAEVDALAVGSFRTGRLRPARLVPANSSTELPVFRAADSKLPEAVASKSLTLSQTLTDLRSRFSQSATVRTAFKVFRIEDLSDRIRTEAYVEMCGGAGTERRQVNATWTCEWTTEETPRLLSLHYDDYEEVAAAGGPLFQDCTVSVLQDNDSYQQQLRYGIDHWCGQIDQRFGIQQNAYHGLAVADVNGDGRDDVYVCQPGGLPNRLYVQNPDGTATDVSTAAGVDFIRATRCALFADLDNDRDQDLILAMVRSLVILENNGQGQFAWRGALPTGSMLFSVAAADYDNDSAVDLFVCGRGEINSGNTIPIPYHDAKNGGANLLFRNQGDFQFVDVTDESGLGADNSRFSQAAAWEDFDSDGDQDLYVANDFGRNNLYRNDDGHFVDVAAAAGVEDLGPGMSVSWGDYNQDGRPDLYVANMFSSAGGRIAFQSHFRTPEQHDTVAALQRHARGNSLFENQGSGTFRDVSEQADVMMGRWAWSSVFADINNDGLQDVLVANGMITETRTHDL